MNRLIYHGSASPQAFYVYSTIKIITASAVTLSNGQLACATTSTFNYLHPVDSSVGSDIFTGINSYAEAYFGYLGFAGYTTSTETASPLSTIDYEALTYLQRYEQSGYTSVYPYVLPGKTSTQFAQVQYAVNTANSTIVSLPAPSAIAITFSTPFVYLPAYGATEYTFHGNEDPANCEVPEIQRNTPTKFGYVPQDLIDWAAQNPDYLEQYPALSDCLPGGPSIIRPSSCMLVSPESMAKATDLTITTAVTINSIGCLGPGHCPQPSTSSLMNVKQSLQSPAAGPVEVGRPTQSSARNPTVSTSQGGMLQGYLIGGQTLVPGASAITISGKIISLGSLATAVVIDDSTMIGASPIAAQSIPVITVGTQLVTADSASKYVVGGQTLTQGESAVTISGSVITFAPVPSNTVARAPVITIGTQQITADSASYFILGGQTITPGETAITISGAVIPIVPRPSDIRIGTGTNAPGATYPLQTFNSVGSRARLLWSQGLATMMLCMAVLMMW